MLIGLYKTLMTLSFPILKATVIKKRKKNKKEHLGRFNERLGIYTYPRPSGKLYWFHGASVGESISMLPLIEKLLNSDENLSILVTTGTITSAEVMEKRLPKRAFHQFIPFDVPKFAKRLLNHFKPDAVLWFESELWPSLISEIHRKKLPLILVNGRISDNSFKNWQRFPTFAKELLSCFSLCLGQSEQDKKRLQFLGAPHSAYVGNLKFSALTLPVNSLALDELKTQINGRKVLLLSSTHSNEEEQFCLPLKELKQIVKDVLIISVPRHPERGKSIKEIYEKNNFTCSLRSLKEPITPQTDIYIADTIGEMGLWYSLADISFVGGSLINHGGQNFIEPARMKNATIVGPNMQNFKEMLLSAKVGDAVLQVQSAPDVIEEAINLFMEPSELKSRQEKAYNWAKSEEKVLDNIENALNKELAK